MSLAPLSQTGKLSNPYIYLVVLERKTPNRNEPDVGVAKPPTGMNLMGALQNSLGKESESLFTCCDALPILYYTKSFLN